MQQAHARATGANPRIDDRLAGAPISSGACEIQGWGVMPVSRSAPAPSRRCTAITGDEPTVVGGLMRDARESTAFLHHTARTTEESNR